MRYLYASGECGYEDYSSGRVLYHMAGTAPFPVKLGCEVFERCRAALAKHGVNGPYTIYDPFCGGGYLLTALGFIYSDHIKRIIASDIDSRMVSLASGNLALLSADGLNQRIRQIEQLISDYGKESHKDALLSALRLNSLLEARGKKAEVHCFRANAAELGGWRDRLTEVDMVITDLPYGRITGWSEVNGGCSEVSIFLESLQDVLPSHCIVAVVSDKKQKVRHSSYRRIDRFNAGKRKVTIMTLCPT